MGKQTFLVLIIIAVLSSSAFARDNHQSQRLGQTECIRDLSLPVPQTSDASLLSPLSQSEFWATAQRAALRPTTSAIFLKFTDQVTQKHPEANQIQAKQAFASPVIAIAPIAKPQLTPIDAPELQTTATRTFNSIPVIQDVGVAKAAIAAAPGTKTQLATTDNTRRGTTATQGRAKSALAAWWLYVPLLIVLLTGYLWGLLGKFETVEKKQAEVTGDTKQQSSAKALNHGSGTAQSIDEEIATTGSLQLGLANPDSAHTNGENTTQLTDRVTFEPTDVNETETSKDKNAVRSAKPNMASTNETATTSPRGIASPRMTEHSWKVGEIVASTTPSTVALSSQQDANSIKQSPELDTNSKRPNVVVATTTAITAGDASVTGSVSLTDTAFDAGEQTEEPQCKEAEVNQNSVETKEAITVSEASGKADDLTKIHGVGPATEKLLQEFGITSFRTLHETSLKRLKSILKIGGSNFESVDSSSWVEQTRFAINGNWDGLSKWMSTHVAATKETPVAAINQRTTTDENLVATSTFATSTKSGKGDDLTKIHGLGPASKKVLNSKGINSFAQVASMTSQQLAALFAESAKRFQLIDPSTWPAQALQFASAQIEQEATVINLETEILDEIDSIRDMASSAKTSSSAPRKKEAGINPRLTNAAELTLANELTLEGDQIGRPFSWTTSWLFFRWGQTVRRLGLRMDYRDRDHSLAARAMRNSQDRPAETAAPSVRIV